MRLNKTLSLIGLCIALHSVIIGSTFYSTTTLNLISDNDSLIKLAWAKFSRAILQKDIKTFKEMTTDCVNCAWCVRNTEKEDSLFKTYRAANEKTWYDKLYSEQCFIPTDKFIAEDYPIIFTKKNKARMRNKFNFVFTDITDYPRLYANPCITDTPDETKLHPIEVLLIDVEAVPEREGSRLSFAFIQVEGQYKFCGFSSVP